MNNQFKLFILLTFIIYSIQSNFEIFETENIFYLINILLYCKATSIDSLVNYYRIINLINKYNNNKIKFYFRNEDIPAINKNQLNNIIELDSNPVTINMIFNCIPEIYHLDDFGNIPKVTLYESLIFSEFINNYSNDKTNYKISEYFDYNNIYMISSSLFTKNISDYYINNSNRSLYISGGIDLTMYYHLDDFSSYNDIRKQLNIKNDDFLLLSISELICDNNGIIELLISLNAIIDYEKYKHIKLIIMTNEMIDNIDSLFNIINKNNLLLTIDEIRNLILNHLIILRKDIYGSSEFINHIYNSANAYISPYIINDFSNNILEAISIGLPVFISGNGSTNEYINKIIKFVPNANKYIHIIPTELIKISNDNSYRNNINCKDIILSIIKNIDNIMNNKFDKIYYSNIRSFLKEHHYSWEHTISTKYYNYFQKIIQSELLIDEKIINKFKIRQFYNFRSNYLKISNLSLVSDVSKAHKNYLLILKTIGFEPKVIYDIGSLTLHWTNEVIKLWPNVTVILFDANKNVEFLYIKRNFTYNIGVLSNEDNKLVRYYSNDFNPSGNSYYRENYDHRSSTPIYSEDIYQESISMTLDTIVKNRKFPPPDFMKLDVQGSELDIIKGSIKTLKSVKHLIVEMQHLQYNDGAPLVNKTLPLIESLGFICVAPAFSSTIIDGDYGFMRLSID